MFDAEIASAMKRSISHHFFRNRVNVEEPTAQKHGRFQQGMQNAYMMIYDHFRATAHAAALDPPDLSCVSLQGDGIQDFDTRWDQALLSASEKTKRKSLESVYKRRIRESVQLQTVSAMCDQENDRDRTMPSCQRLKIMVADKLIK